MRTGFRYDLVGEHTNLPVAGATERPALGTSVRLAAQPADAGVERALLELPRAGRDATLRTLDGHAGLVT